MRKAIKLTATLWVEGEDEPAHDFAASTMRAVREIIAAGRARHPELTLTVKHLVEDESDDENPVEGDRVGVGDDDRARDRGRQRRRPPRH